MTFDRTSWWWRNGRAGVVIFSTLVAAGIVAQPLQNAVWVEVKARQPELKPNDLGDNVGQGMLLGVFGGFRTVLADFVWLQGYHYWEVKDQPDLEAMIYLATTLDPRMVGFWDNGSGELANDIAAYVNRDTDIPDEKKLAAYYKARLTQAEIALRFLDRGLQFNPGEYTLLKDEALIYDNNLREVARAAGNEADELKYLARAADKWRAAAEADDSPFFAGRLYVRHLVRMGKKLEAYTYLTSIYPRLPADAPDAQKAVLWDWIVGLEHDLKLPHVESTQLAPPPGWRPDPDLENLEKLIGLDF
jgi:hypothetical protein